MECKSGTSPATRILRDTCEHVVSILQSNAIASKCCEHVKARNNAKRQKFSCLGSNGLVQGNLDGLCGILKITERSWREADRNANC